MLLSTDFAERVYSSFLKKGKEMNISSVLNFVDGIRSGGEPSFGVVDLLWIFSKKDPSLRTSILQKIINEFKGEEYSLLKRLLPHLKPMKNKVIVEMASLTDVFNFLFLGELIVRRIDLSSLRIPLLEEFSLPKAINLFGSYEIAYTLSILLGSIVSNDIYFNLDPGPLCCLIASQVCVCNDTFLYSCLFRKMDRHLDITSFKETVDTTIVVITIRDEIDPVECNAEMITSFDARIRREAKDRMISEFDLPFLEEVLLLFKEKKYFSFVVRKIIFKEYSREFRESLL